ncbi:MAG TPA: RluA family pseudouridine synthase [Kofleriaceae bacterium]
MVTDDEGEEAEGGEAGEELAIVADHAGRLDTLIAAAVPALSRAQVQRLIDDGHVTLAGVVATKSGARVRPGDAIEVHVPPPEPLELRAEAIPLSILFEDADVIVIDKAAGMVVHPAAGHASGTLVNALLHHCTDLAGIGGVLRPGIVHRLDKDTSGVMIATKTERAHASLTAQFAAKSRGEPGGPAGLSREYLAIASPAPPSKTGTLRTLYGRHPVHRKKFSSKVATGKSAVTHWEIVERLHEAALVRFVLETGRTHQIRVHAADAGWALVGDPVYGHKPRDARVAEVAHALGRQALHAHTLAFAHPATGARLAFAAPLPADFAAALAALRD